MFELAIFSFTPTNLSNYSSVIFPMLPSAFLFLTFNRGPTTATP